jgi:hypothetical protein
MFIVVHKHVCNSYVFPIYLQPTYLLTYYPNLHPSIRPSIHPSIRPSIHPPIYLSVCLSVCPALCMSICLYLLTCPPNIYVFILYYPLYHCCSTMVDQRCCYSDIFSYRQISVVKLLLVFLDAVASSKDSLTQVLLALTGSLM